MAHYTLLSPAVGFRADRETTPLRLGQIAGRVAPHLLWLIFPLTLGLAITRQSLWIDEGFTVWFASPTGFHSFWKTMIGSRGAPGDPQFIFYLLHMWAWVKLFGASELSLRAANIPFAVIYAGAMNWASRRLFWNSNLWALFCLSPFFWFYVNEARPYAAVIAFSSVASVALLAYLVDPDRHGKHAPWVCLIALFLAWGMHILALFLFPVLLILAGTALSADSQQWARFLWDWRRPAIYCLPAFVALFTFFLWVSDNGVNKTEATPGLANLAFAFYEFAGFAGLGPPRNEIRQTQNVSVFLPYWPLLLLAAIVLLAVVYSVFRNPRTRLAGCLAISVACGFAIALLFSRFEHHQILGRHMAMLFPPLVMIPMLSPQRGRSFRTSRLAVASIAALAVVWGISDLRLVFLSKYEKDSYREACALALAKSREEGALIIWAADPVTARYYGLVVDAPGSSIDSKVEIGQPALDRALMARTWKLEEATAHLATSPKPTILVLSRPEAFDPERTWSTLIREEQPTEIARLNALSIYEWRPQTEVSCSTCAGRPIRASNLLVNNASRDHFPKGGGQFTARSSKVRSWSRGTH